MALRMEHSSNKEWDAVAKTYSIPSIEKRKIRLPAFLRNAGKIRNQRVLDFGCGEGFYSRRFAQAGALVTGVDSSETMIEIARRKERRVRQGITYSLGDIRSFSADERFTLIISDFVFNTLSNPEDLYLAIQCAHDALESSGRILVTQGHPARLFVGNSRAERTMTISENFDYFANFSILPVQQSGIERPTIEWTNYHITYSFFLNAFLQTGFDLASVMELGTQTESGFTAKKQLQPRYVLYSFSKSNESRTPE